MQILFIYKSYKTLVIEVCNDTNVQPTYKGYDIEKLVNLNIYVWTFMFDNKTMSNTWNQIFKCKFKRNFMKCKGYESFNPIHSNQIV